MRGEVHVTEDRLCAGELNRMGAGDPGKRRNDHFGSLGQIQKLHGHIERVGAAVDQRQAGKAKTHCELLLEPSGLGADAEPLLLERISHFGEFGLPDVGSEHRDEVTRFALFHSRSTG